MKHREALLEQGQAFRAAIVRAGADQPVPTCPEWDVCRLTRHLARVYAMATMAHDLRPDDPRPKTPRIPEDFRAALDALDDNFSRLLARLSEVSRDRPVWSFFSGGTPATWTRRMLHETAIHRLDAEHAGADVPELLFDPELAADGIDEMLTVILPAANWAEREFFGRVLYHAADAGRTWLVSYAPGRAPEVGSPHDAALGPSEVDATVAGTADAVYRRVWARPSTAVVTGDATLAAIAAGR